MKKIIYLLIFLLIPLVVKAGGVSCPLRQGDLTGNITYINTTIFYNDFDQSLNTTDSVVFKNINITNSTIISSRGMLINLNETGNTTVWGAAQSPKDGLKMNQGTGELYYVVGAGTETNTIHNLGNGNFWTAGNITTQVGYNQLNIYGSTGLNLTPSGNEACAFLYKPDTYGQTGLCFSEVTAGLDIFRFGGVRLAWVDVAGQFHANTRVNTTTLQANVLQSQRDTIIINDKANFTTDVNAGINTTFGRWIVERLDTGQPNCLTQCAKTGRACIMGMDEGGVWSFQNCTHTGYSIGDSCLCAGQT